MGLLNFLFGGGKTTQKQQSTSSGTNTSMPTFDPRFQPMLSTLLARTNSQLNRGTSLPQGFMTNAIEGVNAANQGARTNLEASLAARGLGTSPVAAAAIGGLEQARQGQIGDLGVQSQLLERQFSQEDLANAMNMLGLGRGTTSTMNATSSGSMEGTQPSGGIASLLGMLYGGGFFGGNKKPGATLVPGSFTID